MLTAVTYYTDADNVPAKTINIDCGKPGEYEIYLLDEEHNAKLVRKTSNLTLTMQPSPAVLIREI